MCEAEKTKRPRIGSLARLTSSLTAEDRAKGYILTCVARPVSPVTIEIDAS